MKIGVVGFSRNQFDKKAAEKQLRNHINELILDRKNDQVEIVSGYTNTGVPKIAYQIADELGLYKVGLSARQALRVRCGVYPVDKEIIVGEKFGDESEAFIDYIDYLIRVGGGPQSLHEVEMFKEKYGTQNLRESDVEWYGK